MRIWFKQWKDSRMLRDLVIEDDSDETRTHKVFQALDYITTVKSSLVHVPKFKGSDVMSM